MKKYALLVLLVFWIGPAMASELLLSELSSDLVPSPVAYAVLAPDGYKNMKGLSLILNLHGGGGSRDPIERERRQCT